MKEQDELEKSPNFRKINDNSF